MRRPTAAVLMIAALITALACAHPNEAPLPGESATSSRLPTATGGSDQTERVCEEALAASNDAVDEITSLLAEARTNPVALAQARQIATDWRSEMDQLASEQIRPQVRAQLNLGVEMIDELLAMSPAELAAQGTERQQEIEDFLDDLEAVCA